MPLRKDVKGFGMPWEDQYGYAQAVRVDDTIYVSGQLSHDGQGNMVGAAPLDDSGKIRDHIAAMLDAGQLRPVVGTVLPFAQSAAAYTRVNRRGATVPARQSSR
jgi:NADPH:quinone reductase-like Zn-dependent oxidoreductase